jgi:hypothetical protein
VSPPGPPRPYRPATKGLPVSAIVLTAHSWLRWLVLATGAVASLRAALGWARARPWTALEESLSLAFAVSLDVQWVIGGVLFLGASVLGATALASEGIREVATTPELRFWVLVHPVLGTGALALAHAARTRMRGVADGVARHRLAGLSFGAAVALLLVATVR